MTLECIENEYDILNEDLILTGQSTGFEVSGGVDYPSKVRQLLFNEGYGKTKISPNYHYGFGNIDTSDA